MSRVVFALGLCSLAGILFFLLATLRVVEDLSPQGCRMSRMWPSYILQNKFDTSWSPLARRYSLWLYREVGWESDQLHKGIPVLFIPGNAGSSRQVRSIASSAANQYFTERYSASPELVSRGVKPLDIFAVEFNEDLSAFHGPTLEAETEYTYHAIRYILSMYPPDTQIIVMGHSMGGIVATSLLPSPDISAIITMSTPHVLPPARFDQRINKIYARNVEVLTLDHTPILSLCGGATDMMIPSESCILPTPLQNGGKVPFRRTVFSSALEGAWTGVGHREMVWCHQVRWRVARAALELTRVHTLSEKEEALDAWLRDGSRLPQRVNSVQHAFGSEEYLSPEESLTLRQPTESRRYLLPVSSSHSQRFVLFVSQGSVPPVSPQHTALLQVSVQLCSKRNGHLDCAPLAPTTHKLIPNPIPGEIFPVPDEGADESEGVVLFEAEIASGDGLWVSVDVDRADGSGWVVAGFSLNARLVNEISLFGLFFQHAIVKIPHTTSLRTDLSFPNLFGHALLVYRATPVFHQTNSDTLLHPLLIHASHPEETHYFPLKTPAPRRILLHTHGSAPYIRSPTVEGIELSIYSSDTSGTLQAMKLSIDWMGTFGRWSSRYMLALPCWIVGIVSLMLFGAWSAGDSGAPVPTVYQSFWLFGRRTYPKLLATSFIISLIPVPHNFYLGNAGAFAFAPIAPALLTIATGTIYVSWVVVNIILWPIGKVGKFFSSRRTREDVRSAHRSTLISMGLLFLLIFFVVPWQVAYLACWLIHVYICSFTTTTRDLDDPIPLLMTTEDERVEEEDSAAQEQIRSAQLLQRQTQENNQNYNLHMLLLMTWLLPFVAPVLVVWVRTLVTAGLTTPFDGDHFFLNVAPFLVFVDFASWNTDRPMFIRSRFEKRLSVRWAFVAVAVVAFFVGPRWAYHVFDATRFAAGAVVVLRIGRRYWGGSSW